GRRRGDGHVSIADPGIRPPGRTLPPVRRAHSTPGGRRQGNAPLSEMSAVRPIEAFPFGKAEIDDKPPGSFRKKSARGCMFMGNKQIKEIRFGKLGGSQSLFLSSRG